MVAHVVVPAGFPRSISGPIETHYSHTMACIWPASAEPVAYPMPYGLKERYLYTLIDRYRWHNRRGVGPTFPYPLRKGRK